MKPTSSAPIISPKRVLCIFEAIKMTGIEGDRARRRRVKTVRWTVFRESVEVHYNFAHAATSGAELIGR